VTEAATPCGGAGAPGSQNGMDHSGCLLQSGWWRDDPEADAGAESIWTRTYIFSLTSDDHYAARRDPAIGAWGALRAIRRLALTLTLTLALTLTLSLTPTLTLALTRCAARHPEAHGTVRPPPGTLMPRCHATVSHRRPATLRAYLISRPHPLASKLQPPMQPDVFRLQPYVSRLQPYVFRRSTA
jgi:hypothetical protein